MADVIIQKVSIINPKIEDIARSVNLLADTVMQGHKILPILHAEPSDKQEGSYAYADGTDWNPGSGKGLYLYDGSAWNKL